MHQNQWLAAIEDLRSEGFEDTVVPGIAYEYGKNEYAYQFWNHSEGEESAEGRWASGPSMDGKGEFQYVANPQSIGPIPEPLQPDPRLYRMPKTPQDMMVNGNGKRKLNVVERVVEAIDHITPGG
jgi:Mn-containing catalase